MQRVAIGGRWSRACCLSDDEPLSSLDAKLRGRIAPRLSASSRDWEHDPLCDADQIEAMTMATGSAWMSRGSRSARHPPEIYERPIALMWPPAWHAGHNLNSC